MNKNVPDIRLSFPPDENPHYIRAITQVGDTQEVIAHVDIFESNGMKLVAKGTRIDSRLFNRLTQHRLTAPLDSMLTAKHPVNTHSLVMELDSVVKHEAVYRRILTRTGDPHAMKQALSSMQLAPEVMLRLTVMRERRPELFMHSIHTALIAFALAQSLDLPEGQRAAILLGALCHDFGEMHTDPEILVAEHDITQDERRYIHVHPITGHVLVQGLSGFSNDATLAILQHHERLDGSGYPNALQGDSIAMPARVLAVADVAETAIRRFDLLRVEMLFRLGQKRFDSNIVNALRDLLHITTTDAQNMRPARNATAQVEHMTALLETWITLRGIIRQEAAPAKADTTALEFLFERMATMRSLILQAGFDPESMASMLVIAQDDPDMLAELRHMLDELEWLASDLANEIDRRSPQLSPPAQGALNGLLVQLQQMK
ncbi:HD domain-containing phosphohydrolase [Janthinobacterium sp. 75]|uniref:HD-GYP domain-containing protein n=1 Tax=Janthinobacterium sp. 75 TaxID=2135628 RepID=UPI001063FEFC|nr:HD domain-containing phosphohydrolase [Janthinobacterium sp. 75]TDY36077.1 HD domain-containing protein [Janthinobacterium sp. 75]